MKHKAFNKKQKSDKYYNPVDMLIAASMVNEGVKDNNSSIQDQKTNKKFNKKLEKNNSKKTNKVNNDDVEIKLDLDTSNIKDSTQPESENYSLKEKPLMFTSKRVGFEEAISTEEELTSNEENIIALIGSAIKEYDEEHACDDENCEKIDCKNDDVSSMNNSDKYEAFKGMTEKEIREIELINNLASKELLSVDLQETKYFDIPFNEKGKTELYLEIIIKPTNDDYWTVHIDGELSKIFKDDNLAILHAERMSASTGINAYIIIYDKYGSNVVTKVISKEMRNKHFNK